MNVSTRILLPMFFLAFASLSALALPLYWIGGSGAWDDPNHWSKSSGGVASTYIPNENIDAIFDNNSGLIANSVVTISSGSYAVFNFNVQTSSNFEILFDGTSIGTSVDMNVYGDLSLLPTHSIVYSSPSSAHNVWKFQDSNTHEIDPGGQDLMNVEFVHEQGTYNQVDDLLASNLIRIVGGTWNTNSFDVNSGEIYFRDYNPSNDPITKVFNANNSTITCEEFDSGLTYGSLTVTGNYSIYAGSFVGSPKQANTPPFIFDKIHLTGYTFSGGSVIEQNHFECKKCLVNNLVIETSGQTQLADEFTVVDLFEVKEVGSTLKFNGGNLRLSEVTIEGQFITPLVSDCEERTVFTNVYNDYSTFIRTSGILHAFDAVINNIHTTGGATFKYSNSVLQGTSSGWVESSPPISKVYRWIGNGVIADWNNVSNWELSNGDPADCLPTYVDDVLVDEDAVGGIRIPHNFTGLCRNFTWTNENGLELRLDGMAFQKSVLQVAGDFDTDASAIVTGIMSHGIIFNSNQTNEITANLVVLPKIEFEGALGRWELADNLECDEIRFSGGTLDTKDQDVVTNYWISVDTDLKHYLFGASHIKVNGLFNLEIFPSYNVIIDPGTSLIECEDLASFEDTLFNVQFNNVSSISLDAVSYTFHHLFLGGSGAVTTHEDLTVDQLSFLVDNSTLNIGSSYELNANKSIQSTANVGMPASLNSAQPGVQVDLNHPFNLCASGYLAFEDIKSNSMHILNASDGIDNGNNSNITFSFPFSSDTLHWIGRKGEWQDVSNWSRLSGGCPDIKNPDFIANLAFDEHSFLNNLDTVFVSGTHFCGNILFKNQESIPMIIPTRLNPNGMKVDGGNIQINGKNMTVANETELSNSGYLSVSMTSFDSEILQVNSGLMVIRQNTNAAVQDLWENNGGFCVVEQGAFISAPFIDHINGTLSVSGILKSTNNFYQGAIINVSANGLIDASGTFKNYSTITGNYLITGILENYGSITVGPSDNFQVRQ